MSRRDLPPSAPTLSVSAEIERLARKYGWIGSTVTSRALGNSKTYLRTKRREANALERLHKFEVEEDERRAEKARSAQEAAE